MAIGSSTCRRRPPNLLGFKGNGVAKVRVEYIGRAADRGFRRPPAGGDLAAWRAGAAPILVASAGRSPIALPHRPEASAVDRAVPVPRRHRPLQPWPSRPRLRLSTLQRSGTACGERASRPVSAGASMRYDASRRIHERTRPLLDRAVSGFTKGGEARVFAHNVVLSIR